MEGLTVGVGVILLGKGVHTGTLNLALGDWKWLPGGRGVGAVCLKVKSHFAKWWEVWWGRNVGREMAWNGLFEKLVTVVEQCPEPKFAYRTLRITQSKPGRVPQRRRMFRGSRVAQQPAFSVMEVDGRAGQDGVVHTVSGAKCTQ